MNVKDLRESVGSLEKFFVDPQGEFYITKGLHEELAITICDKNKGLCEWEKSGMYSASDFLLSKGYIKVARYGCFRYVSISKDYARNKSIYESALYISEVLNLKLEIY